MRNAHTDADTHYYANSNSATDSHAKKQSNTASSPYPASSPVRK